MAKIQRAEGLASGSRRAGSPRRHGRAAWMLVALLGLASACSEPQPYKPTFMGRTEGVREPASKPEGLNPLGAIETCADPAILDPGEERVLVARPDLFTREASLMMSALRQAIADNYRGPHVIKFLITTSFIQTDAQAISEGRRCASLIVLWEIYGTRALEMTVPEPTRIPLKVQLHPRLCEFGNYSEQLQILYLTITGLLATLDNDYATANSDMELANRIDNRCLQLPKVPLAGPESVPQDRTVSSGGSSPAGPAQPPTSPR